MTYPVTDAVEWKNRLTPKTLRKRPIHGWYVFPHSFTDSLVHALVDEWRLTSNDKILDPFVGAGTTIVAAQERGIPAVGHDLSPLAVFATNTKAAAYSPDRLTAHMHDLLDCVQEVASSVEGEEVDYPDLVRAALSHGRLEEFLRIANCIRDMEWLEDDKRFFRLGLMSLIPDFSDAVASGGWLKWRHGGATANDIVDAYGRRMARMLADVQEPACTVRRWEASLADARSLPEDDGYYSAVITSPPYPNRHDYTRVFGVELMTFFLNWEENRALRYQSFQSHPEARPKRPEASEYRPPQGLQDCIAGVRDNRLRKMLRGYFVDLYLCLKEIARVCSPGARVAIVVGNAQYDGNSIIVDEYTAELGERTGLRCREIRVVRWRGNSAQQMKTFGRRPSRESIVIFAKE